jgi:hypothetical protein
MQQGANQKTFRQRYLSSQARQAISAETTSVFLAVFLHLILHLSRFTGLHHFRPLPLPLFMSDHNLQTPNMCGSWLRANPNSRCRSLSTCSFPGRLLPIPSFRIRRKKVR